MMYSVVAELASLELDAAVDLGVLDENVAVLLLNTWLAVLL